MKRVRLMLVTGMLAGGVVALHKVYRSLVGEEILAIGPMRWARHPIMFPVNSHRHRGLGK